MKDQMTEYRSLKWARIVGNRHPLDVILDRGLDVFVKVDQTRYFARLVESKVPTTTVSKAGRKEVLTRQRADTSPNGGILLLRLSESQVDEIRATGVCTIEAFTKGGLTRHYRCKLQLGKKTVRVEAGGDAADALFTPVDFVRCELFEKERPNEASPAGVAGEVPTTSEPSVVRLEVRHDDLFLREADVDVLRGQGVSDWKLVPYPLEARSVLWPIYWAYQASIALNRDQVTMPGGVLRWLYDNAPEEARAIRGIKTLASMVRLDYRYRHDFDAVPLADFPKAKELPEEHVSKPLRLLMDITDEYVRRGWLLEDYEKRQIWNKLVAAGFRKTAVRDLYAVLVQAPVTEAEFEEFERTQPWRCATPGKISRKEISAT